jgi:hypothetical protein
VAIQTVPANMIGATQPTNTVSLNAGVAIFEQATTLSKSYCITTGTNAISKSPFTLSDGVVLTVPDGSSWAVI